MFLAALRISLVLLALFMLSEAVLSVDRTGLPYFVVMVDDSASQQVVDQYADPKAKAAAAELARVAGHPEADRLALAQGLLAKDDGAILRELQKKHRVRLYLVSTAARPLAEIDKPEQVAPALEKLKKVEASGDQSRLGSGVRQVLTELRGVPPTAIVLLTDGQTTEGETVAKAAEFAARKGVPLYPIGLGDPEAPRDIELSELLVDDVVFVDDLVRFQPKLTSKGFARQGLTVKLKQKAPTATDPNATKELETIRVTAPPDGQPMRVEIGHRPRETGPDHLHRRGRGQAPRAPGREQPDREDDQRPRGEAQGPLRRQRAPVRVPLPQDLPRPREDDRPERRPPVVRPPVQQPGPRGLADVPLVEGRPVRLRRGDPRRRRPRLPQQLADGPPRRVRHREGGRRPVRRGRELQPAPLQGDAAGSPPADRAGRGPEPDRRGRRRSPRSARA